MRGSPSARDMDRSEVCRLAGVVWASGSDMPRFDELPSEGEMAVIYWTVIVLAALGGVAVIVCSFKTDSVETAIALRVAGASAILTALLVVVGRKIVSYFLD